MNVIIRDRAPFEQLNPTDVAAYLRSEGWTEVEHQPNRLSVWNSSGKDPLEILLPLRRSLGDYVTRMAESVTTLADSEGRSQLEILTDLNLSGTDVVRIRYCHASAADGTIPLEHGERMVEQSRELFLAAGSSVNHPRAYFATNRTEEVRQFVQKLSLGQSERGSYVLTILSKVSPELKLVQPPLFGEPEQPFERKAVSRLNESLSALRGCVDSAGTKPSADTFFEAVPKGVSANLCNALVGINGKNNQSSDELRVSFSWARSRPMTEPAVREITFPSESFPIIAEAARVLKTGAPPEETEIKGFVYKLQATGSGGIATVATRIEGRPRTVKIELDDSEHKKAIIAHDKEVLIRCRGDLTKSGQLWSLQNPGRITLLPEDA